MESIANLPESTIDPFSEATMDNPFHAYSELRALGPVVQVPQMGERVVAVARYAECRAVLQDHARFVSGHGVGFNDDINALRSSSIIGSDPPRHEMLRGVLEERLTPRALRQIEVQVKERASEFTSEAVARGSFDAVTDFAEVFPVEVVGGLIGIPRESRSELLRWANGSFNAFGVPNERTTAGLASIQEQFAFIQMVATRDQLAPGSMGAAIYEAADEGRIPPEYCLHLLSTYLTAGMDTTANAIGAMVWLLAENPDQWQELRTRPELVSAVVSEVLRMESPAQIFSRVASEDVILSDSLIPAGTRVAVFYGSANRDERQYPDPDQFDIHRNPAGHLAFGRACTRALGKRWH